MYSVSLFVAMLDPLLFVYLQAYYATVMFVVKATTLARRTDSAILPSRKKKEAKAENATG